MRIDLKFRYTEDTFLRLSRSLNVANIVRDKNFILIELSEIQKHFLETKQLTKQYIKKNL